MFCFVCLTGQPSSCQNPHSCLCLLTSNNFHIFPWIDFSSLRLQKREFGLKKRGWSENLEWKGWGDDGKRWSTVSDIQLLNKLFLSPPCVGLKASHKKKKEKKKNAPILSVCLIIGALLDLKSSLSGFVTAWGKCLHWKLHLYLTLDICVVSGLSVPRNQIPFWVSALEKGTRTDIFICEASISLNTEDTWRVGMSPVSLLWLSVL